MTFKMSGKARTKHAERAAVPIVPTEGGARNQTIANAMVPQNSLEGYVREISRVWSEAQTKFLLIGRYLLNARATLPHGEFEVMIRERLPFGRSVAHKLRAVASAVDVRRIPEELLPRNYGTAYELTTLDDGELDLARQKGLIRPDVLPREVASFKAYLRHANGPQMRGDLVREHKKLTRDLARIKDRLEAIERELGGVLTIEGVAERELE